MKIHLVPKKKKKENTSCLSVKILTILFVPYAIFLAGIAFFFQGIAPLPV